MTDGVKDDKSNKIDGRTLRTGPRGAYSRRGIGPDRDEYRRCAMLLLVIMEGLGIPLYRTNKSNHIYSYRTKIVLLVLRERAKLSYDGFADALPSYVGVLSVLGLQSGPDPSTLCRFNACVDTDDLESVVTAFTYFVEKDCVLAIDATGFSNFLRSAHFAKRCREFGIKKEPRSFAKASFVGDVKSHLIVSARISPTRRHDSQFIPEHVRDLTGIGLTVSYVLMDKGYDSRQIHRYVRAQWGCTTIIPARQSRGNRGYTTHCPIRTRMIEGLAEDGEYRSIYNLRPQIETTNFMCKMATGSCILSRKPKSIINQGMFKVIAHNSKIVVSNGWDLNYAR